MAILFGYFPVITDSERISYCLVLLCFFLVLQKQFLSKFYDNFYYHVIMNPGSVVCDCKMPAVLGSFS